MVKNYRDLAALKLGSLEQKTINSNFENFIYYFFSQALALCSQTLHMQLQLGT
jgi:hypothetical protein